MGHKNSKKHKATHGGYRDKPAKGAINALLDMYAAVNDITVITATPGKGTPRLGVPVGTQLKLNL